MYEKFDEQTCNELEVIFEAIIAKATANSDKEWAQRTLEIYVGFQFHVENWSSLSPKQCQVIANGCTYNGLNCPMEVMDRAIEAGYKAKHAPITDGVERTVTITQADLDAAFGEIANQLSAQAFGVLLRGKSKDN